MLSMNFQFTEFDAAHLRAAPICTPIGPWVPEHHSFANPATANRTPILFLGSAFQNAWTFLREVKHFMPQRPVILLGQGQNSQLFESLSFAGFTARSIIPFPESC